MLLLSALCIMCVCVCVCLWLWCDCVAVHIRLILQWNSGPLATQAMSKTRELVQPQLSRAWLSLSAF